MNLSFELLRADDIPSVKEIAEVFIQSNPERIKAFLSEKQNIALVAKLDGIIVGLIYGYSLTRLDGKMPQFFIYAADIHPSYQDKGHGSRFMKYAVDWARRSGFSESFVITEKVNPRACRVYEKAGMTHSKNDDDRLYVVEYKE